MIMLLKTATSVAFATACLSALALIPAHAQMTGPTGTEIISNGPQSSPPANWSARQNVVESHRYDRLLETNRSFREARERKECGPITDPQMHQACLASFRQDEPYAGSSMPRHRTYPSSSGR
jgi:hypothetical protein